MTDGRAALLVGSGLSKRFRRVTALADVSIALDRGDSVALLGPNGAGKTTLLRILVGASSPTSGRVGNGSPSGSVGWVPQFPAVYRKLTTRENLRFFCELERVPDPAARAEELLDRADLTGFADRPAGELSTGTLQRLNLAVALAGAPSALVLDEPTATLSPEQVRRIWSWLDELRAGGVALLFSTQSVEETVRHAGRVVILNGGRAVFEGTVDALVAAAAPSDLPRVDAAERAFLELVGAGT